MEKYSIVQAIKAIDRADIALILLDAKEGISEQDVKIAGLALEKGTACILVVNKWDLVEKDNSTIGTFVENIRYNAKFLEFAPIIFVSALSGQRVSNIFALIERVYAQYTRRVETGELNRKIREIIEANPPPGRQEPTAHLQLHHPGRDQAPLLRPVRPESGRYPFFLRALPDQPDPGDLRFRRGPDPSLLPEKEAERRCMRPSANGIRQLYRL